MKKVHRFMRTFTSFMYCLILIMSVIWVTVSYVIAIYGALVLMQLEPLVDLSRESIACIIAVVIAKTVTNIFEHNDSVIFGISKETKKEGEEDEVNG